VIASPLNRPAVIATEKSKYPSPPRVAATSPLPVMSKAPQSSNAPSIKNVIAVNTASSNTIPRGAANSGPSCVPTALSSRGCAAAIAMSISAAHSSALASVATCIESRKIIKPIDIQLADALNGDGIDASAHGGIHGTADHDELQVRATQHGRGDIDGMRRDREFAVLGQEIDEREIKRACTERYADSMRDRNGRMFHRCPSGFEAVCWSAADRAVQGRQ